MRKILLLSLVTAACATFSVSATPEIDQAIERMKEIVSIENGLENEEYRNEIEELGKILIKSEEEREVRIGEKSKLLITPGEGIQLTIPVEATVSLTYKDGDLDDVTADLTGGLR